MPPKAKKASASTKKLTPHNALAESKNSCKQQASESESDNSPGSEGLSNQKPRKRNKETEVHEDDRHDRAPEVIEVEDGGNEPNDKVNNQFIKAYIH